MSYETARKFLLYSTGEDLLKQCLVNKDYQNICKDPNFWIDKFEMDGLDVNLTKFYVDSYLDKTKRVNDTVKITDYIKTISVIDPIKYFGHEVEGEDYEYVFISMSDKEFYKFLEIVDGILDIQEFPTLDNIIPNYNYDENLPETIRYLNEINLYIKYINNGEYQMVLELNQAGSTESVVYTLNGLDVHKLISRVLVGNIDITELATGKKYPFGISVN